MFRASSALPTIHNTIFSRNINLMLMNGDSKNQIMVNMYKKLAAVVQTINTLMLEYSNANFYAVANILTLSMYNKLSVSLSDLAASATKYPDYETIRLSSTSSLKGLYQSILQYSDYVDVKHKLEICEEHESILYDRVKLQDFINKLNQNKRLFPESNVKVTKATLKPEYAEYIKQYGFPEGSVFDPDRLGHILRQMEIV
jgi:hypothetical protein